MTQRREIEIAPNIIALAGLTLLTGLLPFLQGGSTVFGRLGATLIVVLVAVMWLFGTPRTFRLPRWSNPDMVWLGVLVLGLLSLIGTPSLWNSLHGLWYLVSGYLLFVTIRQYDLHTDLPYILRCVIYSALPVIAWSLYKYFLNAGHVSRIGGPFNNADALGAYLVFPLFAGIALLMTERNRWWRLGSTVALFVIAITLLLTVSVTAIGSCMLTGIIALLFFRKKLQPKKILWPVVILFILAGTSLGIRALVNRNSGGALQGLELTGTKTQVQQRLSLVHASWNMAVHEPLRGIGLGSWAERFPQFATSTVEHATNPYGIVFQYLGEGGLLFVLVFLWLLGITLVHLFRTAEKNFVPMLAVVALGIFTMAINGLVDSSWSYPGIVFLFWAMAGLVLSADGQEHDQHNPRVAGIVLALALLATAWGLLRFTGSYLVAQAQHSAKAHDFSNALGSADLAMRAFPSPEEANELVTLEFLASDVKTRALTKSWADTSLARDKQFAPAYLVPARLAREQSDPKAAEMLYKKSLMLDPHWTPEASSELVRLYLDTGRYAEAETVATQAIAQLGQDIPQMEIKLSELWEFAGVAALNLGKKDVAKMRLEQAVALNPKNTRAAGLLKAAFQK